MQSKPLQTDGESRIFGQGTLSKRKLILKQRLFDEVIKFLAIAFYLWVMFGVFALHESVVSAKDHIEYHFYGGGTPSGVFFVGVILAVALIPFFAFREVGRAIGERALHSLMFTGQPKAAAFRSGMG